MKQELNIKQEDLTGEISVKLANGQTLDDFCTAHIPEYNLDRFEALAIRMYVGDETVITIYAIDKTRQENSTVNSGKIPVKKFKITTLAIAELFSYCSGFNCTVTTGNYSLEDMEVVNR